MTQPPAALDAPSPSQRVAGVILAAGRGTRMGRTRIHKVCFPIAGRPAIVRLIDTLRAENVDPIVVVVGDRAGDVVQTIGRAHTGIHFVYQRDQLGTGHAARLGVEALARFGYDGTVLMTMGDKWFCRGLITRAVTRFRDSGARLLVVSTPKPPATSAGRLVRLPGRGICGIVERRDIERARILEDWLRLAGSAADLSAAALREAGLRRIRPSAKLWRALGKLARFCRGRGTVRSANLVAAIREATVGVRVLDRVLTPDQVERFSHSINQSVYIAAAADLWAALLRVGRANAQDEYYVTDIIGLLAGGDGDHRSRGKPAVVEYRLRGAGEAMAYNTRAELDRISERVLQLEKAAAGRTKAVGGAAARYSRPIDEWLRWFSPATGRGASLIERTYGFAGPLVPDRLRALRAVVRLFGRTYGHHRRVMLIRAPGRINLMGRHIDHQGGLVHVMALDRETLLAVSPRNDDVIRLVNVDRLSFPPRELILGDWQQACVARDWLAFVDGERVKQHLASTAGDWSNYVLAAAVYQQHRHPHRRLRGMDVAVCGNVPIGAGLSSSSALVVAAMEAIVAVNDIPATPARIVDWCGQAEWFVGSRGGSADQAAIRLGRAGFLARLGFFPFRLVRYVRLPADAAVLVADSGHRAIKSAGVRSRFNERVANYRLGMLWLQHSLQARGKAFERAADLMPERSGMSVREVYEALRMLPERITRRELRHALGKAHEEALDRIFSSHAEPDHYTLRDLVAFGVGECERSRLAAEYLDRRDLEGFGELMRLSHDGDRVVNAPPVPCPLPEEDDGAPPLPLYRLMGAYACSTPAIDEMVDIASAVPGVYGAQLAGAGLGGAIMILAETRAVGRVRRALIEKYYEPRGMEPAVWQVRSVNGGGLIRP